MSIPSIIDYNTQGKRVLVRAGLNVPLIDGAVASTFRLNAAQKTLLHLSRTGARTLIIAHIGRDPHATLAPVYAELKKTLPMKFVTDIFSDEASHALAALQNSELILFENIRQYPEEKANDAAFGERLAHLAEIYVNDAFEASHRAHASIVGVPKYIPAFAGLLFADEVRELTRALTPPSPSLFLIGGAKFETKQPILKMALETYDRVCVGGALAHDLLRARGVEIGKSLASERPEGIDAVKNHPKLFLPVDAVVRDGVGKQAIRTLNEIRADDTIFDIGPESIRAFSDEVKKAASVVWNGPLGYYEGGFGASTETLAEVIASRQNIQSIVGGGDTIAAIDALGLEKEFTFLSTGGGAMLEFLAEGTLVGIEALKTGVRA